MKRLSEDEETELRTCKQVEEARNSKISTSELISELRKRDGVAIFEIEENESFEIQTWDRVSKIKDYDSGQGKAIILIRITD